MSTYSAKTMRRFLLDGSLGNLGEVDTRYS